MDEKKTTVENQTTTTTTSLPNYADPQRAAKINEMYDANIASQKANLQQTLDSGISNYEQNKKDIAKSYQQQRNAQAVDYERQRRNFNQQASLNGLNTGTASQAQLAQNSANQGAMANLRSSEATQVAQQDKSIADLKLQTQQQINEAVATNDYNRAAAMLDEYQQAYQNAMSKAETLASYGDFSGYAGIYGQEQADKMAEGWALQNPSLAYTMGKITAKQYFQLTGKYPPGYSTGGGGGRRWSGGTPRGDGENGDGDTTDIDTSQNNTGNTNTGNTTTGNNTTPATTSTTKPSTTAVTSGRTNRVRQTK